MSLFDQISSPYGVGAAPFRPPAPQLQPNDSVLSATSRGAMPMNAYVTNFGQKHNATAGRAVLDCLVDVDYGASAGFTQNGGSPQSESNGCAGPGAGQQSQQTAGFGSGCTDQLPHNASASSPTFANPPNYQG